MKIDNRIFTSELNDPARWTTPESELMGYARDEDSAKVIAATLNALIDRAERAEAALDRLQLDRFGEASEAVYRALQNVKVSQVLQHDGSTFTALPVLDCRPAAHGLQVTVGCPRLAEK